MERLLGAKKFDFFFVEQCLMPCAGFFGKLFEVIPAAAIYIIGECVVVVADDAVVHISFRNAMHSFGYGP